MTTAVDILTSVIIQQYFVSSRCVLIFTDELTTFNSSVSDVPVVLIETDTDNIHPHLIFHYYGCQAIVMKTSRPLWLFKTLENAIRLSIERFNKRRYLIVPGIKAEENIMNIFKLNELDYVSDLVVIEEESRKDKNNQGLFLQNEDSTYNVWTHIYVGNNHSNEKMLLDVWFSRNNTFKYGYNIYPNKLINQMGRALKMATFQYEPYSIIGPTIDQYRGSEMLTTITFTKMYNMTAIAVVNTEDYWGEIFSNWTGNGLLGNIVLDRADVGFCALYTWESSYHYLDLSKPLVRTGITCLVPSPQLAAGWLTPLYSYSPAMWIAVGLLFVTSILSLFLIHYFNVNVIPSHKKPHRTHPNIVKLLHKSILSIYKLFVVQVVTKEEIPKSVNGSYMIGLLFLFSLFLTSTYSSGFSSIMTVPRYENPINTVEEFSRSGLHWGAPANGWITSIEDTEEPIYQEIVRRFHPLPEEELREESKTGKFALSVERLPRENYAVGSYIKADVIGNFHLMQHDIYWEQCVMMTRKSSILLPLLDMFILRVFEAGLITYWQNEAVMNSMDAYIQKAVKYNYHHKSEHDAVKLKWTHVEGAFGALYIGYGISIFVFLLELFDAALKRGSLVISRHGKKSYFGRNKLR